jgi:putative ABC transport system permease protein
MRRPGVREHTSSILVAALSSAFGVALLQVTAALGVILGGNEATGDSSAVQLALTVVAAVFIVIAIFVAAQVTANTFATIIAGRTRTIALMRLLGATASSQRSAVAREGLVVGVVGASVGALVGTGVIAAVLAVLMANGTIPELEFSYLSPVLLLPVVAVVVTTWVAAWAGSRRVLTVSPMAATGAAQEESREESVAHRGRNTIAGVGFVLGIVLLLVGAGVGTVSILGLLIGVVGGVVSFTGLVLGATLVMPPALRTVGLLFGSTPTARLAAANAVRYPQRTSRNTIGLVIGVTLVSMFTVAASTFATALGEQSGGAADPVVNDLITTITLVFAALTGFSALIAAVGMVNNLSLSVLQRTRELGLLRALGLSSRQVRAVVVLESVQLTATAAAVGLALGIFYGWAGAQALLGSLTGGGLLLPVVPPALAVAIVIVVLLLTAVSSFVPARRATRVSAVAALAVQ